MTRVVVGMSGGVDSSLAAAILKDKGYDVVGLFMHNWKETGDDGVCTAEQDYADVRRVCNIFDIPYYTVDLSKEYWDGVFSHFVEEYKRGRTPNPDVLCNREIKFGAFKREAEKIGADYVATGHYCGVWHSDEGRTYLTRAQDDNKDQTYFLNQVSEEQIKNVLFPLQPLTKTEVRGMAEKLGIPTAHKKDSTGVCFIGERNFRKFLSEYVPMKKGEIRTLDGRVIGEHEGVYFYTVGQHKGFGLGGVKGCDNVKPWYVIRKDVENNVLYVCQGEPDELYSTELFTEGFHFITDTIPDGKEVLCRIRHRQPLQKATFFRTDEGARVVFCDKQRAVAPGQYCVLYDDRICLGGGVINRAN
ncbi:MAG: tRNA 2-thiouridine(34) synthase MnmA [Clostridia bacterium]|nr:tRNA 2-thiouridine(34) synthase MnmA [Clostridia bacterium]